MKATLNPLLISPSQLESSCLTVASSSLHLFSLAYSLPCRLLSTPSSSLRISSLVFSFPCRLLSASSSSPHLPLKAPASLPHYHLSILTSSLPCRLLSAPSSSLLEGSSLPHSHPSISSCLPLVSLESYYPLPPLHLPLKTPASPLLCAFCITLFQLACLSSTF